MSREIDARDPNVNRATPDRLNELQTHVDQLQGLAGGPEATIEKLDPLTGNPALIQIKNPGGLQTSGGFVQRALDFVQTIKGPLGLAPTQPAEFEPDPVEQVTSSGSVSVHLQQKYKGISIFQAAQTVRFDSVGALTEVAGTTVTVPQDLSVTPTISVEEATRRAAHFIAEPTPDELNARDSFGQPLNPPRVDVSNFQPKVLSAFLDQPERVTVLEAGPFGKEISAGLLWFPVSGTLRLVWELVLTMPQMSSQYRVLVDAQDGTILYSRNLVQTVAAQGNVYVSDGEGGRQMITFPKPYAEYGLPLTPDLAGLRPMDWVEADATDGNSVRAYLGEDSNMILRGVMQNNIVIFNPNDPLGDEQKVLNIFYLNCLMHDFFYLLGFRERDGNFQRISASQSNNPGLADPVHAQAHSVPVWGTANFFTPVDGQSPTMNMGLVETSNRHTAFDATVVIHEYTHGVTNRLVGGRTNSRALEAPQSAGMGEGWGDYFAATVTNRPIMAAWCTQMANGIRGFRYDNFPANTENFSKLGQDRYSEVHAIGEIWCATLLEINRNLGTAIGNPRGVQLALQLVVDALKLSHTNPSFLDMRDAILTALEHKRQAGQLDGQHPLVLRGVWQAFAKFGMGPAAHSNGAALTGIVADFSVPQNLPSLDSGGSQTTAQVARGEVSPVVSIPDNDQNGVTSTIMIAQSGIIRSLKVSVDITHSYIGDLQIGMMSPGGRLIMLHDRAGGDQHNLKATYDSTKTASLASILGQSAQGNWMLGVRDLQAQDTGVLNNWTLELQLALAGSGLTGEDSEHRFGYD